MRSRHFAAALDWLTRLQLRAPWRLLFLVLLTLVPTGYFASRLTVKSSFSELLPDDKPSVVEMRRVEKRLPTASTLTVAIEASNAQVIQEYVDAVAPKILAFGAAYVSGVDTGPRAAQDYFAQNKHLYAKVADLRELREKVVDSYDKQVAKAAGWDLGLDDEQNEGEPERLPSKTLVGSGHSESPTSQALGESAPSEPDAFEEALSKLEAQLGKATLPEIGLNGYYIGENGHFGVILVRTPLSSGNRKAFELRQRIENLPETRAFARKDPSFHIGFTGNLITSAEQHDAVVNDLTHVGLLGVALVMGVVFLFFLRLRMVLALGTTILVGLVWSFAVARWTVGYLNTATGFLVSIIAGNGINFGIIYMGRYIEARRDEGRNVTDSIMVSQQETRSATLAASAAAMVAYGSLAITDFRGFRHFGVIGGAGMLLCWLATYATLPLLLVLSERVRPMFEREASWRRKLKGVYGMPFAWITRHFAKPVAIIGFVAGLVAAIFTLRYFLQDPMEYDMGKIRNDRTAPSSAGLLSLRVDEVVGRLGQDGRAIVVDHLSQVQPLEAELNRRRDAVTGPATNRPFDKVVSIFDLLPAEQPEKLELLHDIQEKLERAHDRHAISESQWQRISKLLPTRLASIGIDDLPDLIAGPFTEKNGTRGTIVYIVPTTGRSVYDAHYLFDFADAFRETRLPDGSIVRGTGDPVIFSDMLINVKEDAPKAIALSLFGTLLVLVLAFRRTRSMILAIGTLLVGVGWLVSMLWFADIKLNFLNFVALPITIGVGADYVLNIVKRRDVSSGITLDRLLIETGGAVVLCSLTTMLGYFALLSSINGAVRSFGLAAGTGEVTTLLAAVLFLPAWLSWRKRRSA